MIERSEQDQHFNPQEGQGVANGLYGSNTNDAIKVQSSWNKRLVEVSVFLFLIVPSMALSFFAVKQGSLNFVLVAIATILRDLALVSLILFFLWRNGEPINWIGWTFKNSWKEIGLGIGLYIPFFITAGFLERALQVTGLSVPSTPLPFMAAKGMGELWLAIGLVAVVAMAEETIFRGYLILRLKAITASPAAAALLSAAIFSLGHGYEGSAGVVTVGVMGLVFALIYMWRKSLVAPIVMHFLQDFIGIVLLPWVGKG
jgi:membrane protease YdiL (CAAX protease family)